MRRTPLYDEHVALGGKVVDFHGWALPVQYSGILDEHEHCRTKAALFDCSHMGEFHIWGRDAIEAYSELVCSDPIKLPVGRCRYGAMLNDEGGIIDDVITFKMGEEDLFVVTNAGPLDHVSARICGSHPDSKDVSAVTAKIDIQGPLSRDILSKEIPEAAPLKYFQARYAKWEGVEIVLSRTGYTGELGYELFVPNKIAVELWRRLLAYEGVKPAGLGARDTLRTEVCYALSGQDFDQARTPLEANMEQYIAWDKKFVGRHALKELRDMGSYSVLTPIKTADRRAPRHGFDVFHSGDKVGVVTSGTFGPSVGHGVGLAYIPRDLAVPGTQLTVGPKELPVEVAKAPIYAAGTCRV